MWPFSLELNEIINLCVCVCVCVSVCLELLGLRILAVCVCVCLDTNTALFTAQELHFGSTLQQAGEGISVTYWECIPTHSHIFQLSAGTSNTRPGTLREHGREDRERKSDASPHICACIYTPSKSCTCTYTHTHTHTQTQTYAG